MPSPRPQPERLEKLSCLLQTRAVMRGSSRRPPRTSARSRRTCAASSSARWTCRTRSSRCFASRRSATTIPASAAPRTSSTSRSNAA